MNEIRTCSWLCCTPLPAQTATAMVIVVAGATVAWPLHQHLLLCNCCLWPHHTVECWRGPRPLSLTGRLIGRWNPRTLMTLCGVTGWCRVQSTIGLSLTRLHRPKVLRHQAYRGRRREERKMKTPAARSLWSSAPLGHRRYARLRGSLTVQGADPKDSLHHGPPPHRQARRLLPSLCRDHRRHFLQARPALRAPGRRRI
jgi:hypothetical protein